MYITEDYRKNCFSLAQPVGGLKITSGAGGPSSGNPGSITISAGTLSNTKSNGGRVYITGGNGSVIGNSGSIYIIAGISEPKKKCFQKCSKNIDIENYLE